MGRVPPPRIAGRAAVLMDVETGTVLCSLRPHAKVYPASLTKMLTALVVVNSADADELVTVSPRAAAVGETTMNLQAGEQITVRHLLEGALIASANDAAVALAIHVAGSVPAFAGMMNEEAARLGLADSHFVNPHGLHDPRHYSSAADMATIARKCLQHPLLRRIVATRRLTLPWPGKPYDRLLVNRTRLLHRWEECDGIKTGYTRQAGNCIAASATRDGWQLLCVVMNSRAISDDSRNLLQWAFDNFRPLHLAVKGASLRPVAVKHGTHRHVLAAAARSVTVVLPADQLHVTETLQPPQVSAPVHRGQVVATLKFTLPTGATRTVPLVAEADVPATLWSRVRANGRALALCVLLFTIFGSMVLYGAAAKAVGTSRRRFPPRQRRAYPARPRHR